jgi:hypothetical protein
MTRGDAEVLAKIIATADGGCRYCAQDLAKLCTKAFGPRFEFVYKHEEGELLGSPWEIIIKENK